MREILNESLWGDLTNKVKSAKLNKEIEESLIGLIYRYYNDGEKCGDSRSDFYGYATKYCDELETLTDDNVFDIIYEPRVRYEKKLQTLVNYICDTYGKNSMKESARKVIRNSINESSFSFVTVSDFCKHCASNMPCQIWSVDGHHKYDEVSNLNKIQKSSYKYHEVMMWDIQYGTIILYIENDALAF